MEEHIHRAGENHRNVLHHICAYTNNLHIDAADRLALLASYGFDAAVMDIYGALLNGATLCLFDIRNEGLATVPDWLSDERISIYHSTPTVYRQVMRSMEGNVQLGGLRLEFSAARRYIQPILIYTSSTARPNVCLSMVWVLPNQLSRSSIFRITGPLRFLWRATRCLSGIQ
jgi:non-ribosomal peptide synthetase component F